MDRKGGKQNLKSKTVSCRRCFYSSCILPAFTPQL